MLTAALLASGRPASGQQLAAVEGDAFLVMASGDVKPVAGTAVRLVRLDAAAGAAVAASCQVVPALIERRDSLRRALYATTDSVHRARGRRKDDLEGRRDDLDGRAHSADLRVRDGTARVLQVLARASVAESPTGVQAHYSFRDVQPGTYALWLETSVFGTSYVWFRPVILAGQAVRFDLDNRGVQTIGDETDLIGAYCGAASPVPASAPGSVPPPMVPIPPE
jgi:hypothetical protein